MGIIKDFLEIIALIIGIILPLAKFIAILLLIYAFASGIVIYIRWKHTRQSVANEIIPWWTGLIKTWIAENTGISILNKNSVNLSIAEQQYYPILLEALYEILSAKFEIFDIFKPKLASDLITTNNNKVTDSPNGVVYEYTALLESCDNPTEEELMKQILQKELIKRSHAGFEGIVFVNGYPIIQVHEMKILNAYLHIRLIVLWNETDMEKYSKYCDNLLSSAPSTSTPNDEVF